MTTTLATDVHERQGGMIRIWENPGTQYSYDPVGQRRSMIEPVAVQGDLATAMTGK